MSGFKHSLIKFQPSPLSRSEISGSLYRKMQGAAQGLLFDQLASNNYGSTLEPMKDFHSSCESGSRSLGGARTFRKWKMLLLRSADFLAV